MPFVALSKANNWTYRKTLIFTFLCGIGHVASSVLLGFIGIIVGIEITKIERIQSALGDVAAWLLLSFGIIYTLYGIRHYYREKHSIAGHKHHGFFHFHKHGNNTHEHKTATNSGWALFLIFIFGPCEPLIPLLMYPAAHQNLFNAVMVSTTFSLATIGTMLITVTFLYKGVSFLPLKNFTNVSHIVAGILILVCGIAIFMGL